MIKLLRKAIKANQLVVFYQPQVNIRTGKIIGTEALVRWNHPELGIVPPDEFIPMAESTRLIIPIGEWVLRTACTQNKAWQDAGFEPMTISVNLSLVQFTESDIVVTVTRVLEQTGLAPQYLDLEITESMTMDLDRVLYVLKELKSLGVKISLDDFGKGYSSLYYLKRLPIDTLKIDQSFVADCTVDTNDAMIVKTIISMAHQLNLNVIAEGVETREHLVFLQQNLCNDVQGYLLSKPLPALELEKKFTDIQNRVREFGISNELTEQMWLEEQLRIVQQDLEDTVRMQQGTTFKFREQSGRFIHTLCDGELLYSLGLKPRDVVGKELHHFLPEDQVEYNLHHYRRAFLGEPNVTYDFLQKGIWCLVSLRPIIRGGKVVEVIGNILDISDRKLAEKAMEESEERYRQLVEMSPNTIIVHDHGEALFINQSGRDKIAELIGSELPLQGQSIFELIGSESRSLSVERMERMMKGERMVPVERSFKCPNGEIMDVMISSSLVDFKGRSAVQVFIMDITERKRNEEALQKVHEQYRLIAENMSDLITVFDAKWNLIYASPSHQAVLGHSAEHITTDIYNLIHSDDLLSIQNKYNKMIATKSQQQIMEFRIKHSNGNWVNIETKLTPLVLENGDLDSILLVSRDVTARKLAEKENLQSKAQAAVKELASEIAYELRKPIIRMKELVQLMKSGKINQDYFENMLDELESLELKTEKLLQLATPQTVK